MWVVKIWSWCGFYEARRWNFAIFHGAILRHGKYLACNFFKTLENFFIILIFAFLLLWLFVGPVYILLTLLLDIICWLKCQYNLLVYGLSTPVEFCQQINSPFAISAERTWVRWDKGGMVVLGIWPRENRVRCCIYFLGTYALFVRYYRWIIYMKFFYTLYTVYFPIHFFIHRFSGCKRFLWHWDVVWTRGRL